MYHSDNGTDNRGDLRAEVRFKNGALLRALEDSFGELTKQYAASVSKHGYKMPLITVAAQISGVHRGLVYEWAGLRTSPYSTKNWKILKAAKRFCEALDFDPEVVFPRTLYGLGIPKLVVKEFHSADVISLQEAAKSAFCLPSVEQNLKDEQMRQSVDSALNLLTPRQEKVMRLRFGLGCDEHTLEEIASEFDVTKECIRQIESSALRRMREPKSFRMLRGVC